MFPLLLEIPLFGGIKIYTYGLLVALGFVLGTLWTVHEGKRVGVKSDFILDLVFYIILAALIGSRILYVLIDWKRYVTSPLDVLKIWEGGLVFYGGLIGALLVSFYFIRKKGFRFLKIADLFAPGIALGHAIGRLGCFAAGCCYGREAVGFPLAITFPANPISLAPTGIPLYPSQLFESAAAGAIFMLLVLFRRRKKFEGQIFLLYAIFYGMTRIGLEFFRGDSVRGFLIPNWLSTSQFISVGFVVFACVTYVALKRKVEHGGSGRTA